MSFDYGAEKAEVKNRSFKNPKVGTASALVRSIIHLGSYREEFKGKVKDPANYVTIIFELKRKTDLEDDGETPLEISISVPLRGGEKSWLTKIEKALLQEGDKGFDDWIGRACSLQLEGSKELLDNGDPKYVNVKGIFQIDEDTLETLEDKGRDKLVTQGVGHVTYGNLTKPAIEELHPVLEVANILMKAETYPGSVAEGLVAEIRKDNPDFAKSKAKSESNVPAAGASDDTPAPTANGQAPSLDDDEEF